MRQRACRAAALRWVMNPANPQMCLSPTTCPMPLPRRTSTDGVIFAMRWTKPGSRPYCLAQTADTTASRSSTAASMATTETAARETASKKTTDAKRNKDPPPGKTTPQIPEAGEAPAWRTPERPHENENKRPENKTGQQAEDGACATHTTHQGGPGVHRATPDPNCPAAETPSTD